MSGISQDTTKMSRVIPILRSLLIADERASMKLSILAEKGDSSDTWYGVLDTMDNVGNETSKVIKRWIPQSGTTT